MYASHPASSRFGRTGPQHADMYSRVGVETSVSDASPHRLVTLLFDGFAESVAHAKAAIVAQQTDTKGRATRIVEEGLKAALDLDAGGGLAADLDALYAYIGLRLTHANLRNDVAALEECLSLMQPLRDAWSSIAPQVAAPRG